MADHTTTAHPSIEALAAIHVAAVNSATAVLAHDFGPPPPRGERARWSIGSPPPDDENR